MSKVFTNEFTFESYPAPLTVEKMNQAMDKAQRNTNIKLITNVIVRNCELHFMNWQMRLKRESSIDMREIQFLMYEADALIEVIVKDETIWATQKALTELFGVDRTSISRHLKNVFENRELIEKVVSAEIAQTTRHGAIEGKTQTKRVKFYNLDAIISVGYRVNSVKATRFCIWATDILKEFIQKGFKNYVERMKQGETVLRYKYTDLCVSI